MKPGEDTQPHVAARDGEANTASALEARATAASWWRDAIGLLIASCGATLCVQAYLQQHSLFIDEARLLENVLSRRWSELTDPLTQGQAAPVGFLYLLKLSIAWVGENKLGFRAVPMVGGVASMFLFWGLMRRLVRGWPAWLGMAVFASGSWTVYYAQQTKQYTVELAVALALLCLLEGVARRGLTAWRLAGLAVAGAVATWLSVTAVIVLAGCGAVLLVMAIRGKRPAMVGAVLGVGVLWVGSFLVQYVLVLNDYSDDEFLANYWRPFYLRVIPQLPHRVLGQLSGVFTRPVDLELHQLGFALWALGMWAAARSRRALPWALVAGWLVLAGLSMAGEYPYGDRQVLFALPMLIGLMVMGVAWLRTLGRPGEVLAIVAALTVASAPVFSLVNNLTNTGGHVRADDELEPVILELRERVEPGDIVWVGRGAAYMTRFLATHSDAYDLAPAELRYSQRITGQRHWVLDEIQSFRGQPRVWLLMSHSLGRSGVDELVYVQLLAKQMGQKIDVIQRGDSIAALFDFTAGPTPPPSRSRPQPQTKPVEPSINPNDDHASPGRLPESTPEPPADPENEPSPDLDSDPSEQTTPSPPPPATPLSTIPASEIVSPPAPQPESPR